MKSKDKLFDELISYIQKQRTLIKQLIEAREKLAVVRAEALQLKLEEEIARLKKRDADLEQLSHTEDHIHFIQVGNVCILCCRPTQCFFLKFCHHLDSIFNSVFYNQKVTSGAIKAQMVVEENLFKHYLMKT